MYGDIRRRLAAVFAAAATGAACVMIGTPSLSLPAPTSAPAQAHAVSQPGLLGLGAAAVSSAPFVNPPTIPRSGVYLGIDPNFNAKASFQAQSFQFEHKIHRDLGLVSIYLSFGQMPPMRDIDPVARQGALPLINMNCGPSDAAVASGRYDRRLEDVARELKSYGRPILFRWFWEMNLTHVNGHARCLGTKNRGAEYIAAFRHIWTIFQRVGAKNVAFVWCPSNAASAPHKDDLTYYPGNQYVAWIGADIYDRPKVHKSFGQQFDAFYRHWAGVAPNKPFIIAETGAVGSAAQVTWLNQIQSAFTKRIAGLADTPFTRVHALCYVDAVDIYDYVLKVGTAGFSDFRTISHEPYFAARVAK